MNPMRMDNIARTRLTPRQYVEATGGKWETLELTPGQKRLFLGIIVLVVAGVLSGCIPANSDGTPVDDDGSDDPDVIDLNNNGIADNLEISIPQSTTTPEANVERDTVDVQTYTSNLGVVALHIFNPDGSLFGFTLLNGAETSTVVGDDGVVTLRAQGNDFSNTKNYFGYDENGHKGYFAGEQLNGGEMLDWLGMMDVNEQGEANLSALRAILEEDPNLKSDVVMSTSMNVDEETGLLVDMGLTITIKVGAQEFVFAGDLDPIEKGELYKDYQIASTNNNFDAIPNSTQVQFELVPPDWVELDGVFVSPAFAQLDKMIDEAGERFDLNVDGTVSDGEGTIPGLSVDRTGVMTLVVDGELVTLDPADVSFDDEEGIKIKGYEQDDTGEWVPAAPPIENTEAGQATMAVLDQMGVDPSTIELKMDGDSIVCIDKETGDEACRDGEFDLHWLVPKLPAENLEKTSYKPINGVYMGPPSTMGAYDREVLKSNIEIFDEQYPDRIGFTTLLLHDFTADGGSGYAWGYVVLDAKEMGVALAYMDVNGHLHLIPIEPIQIDEVINYYVN